MDSGEFSETLKSHVRNPTGTNQHKDCPPKSDPRVSQLLYEYHRRQITDKREISRLLLSEHGIKMSESSVARRRRVLGIYASGVTTRQLPDNVKRQLVLNQMAKDPSKKLGPRMIKQHIARETGINLTRDYIRSEMLRQDPEGFANRDTSVKVKRLQQQQQVAQTILSPS